MANKLKDIFSNEPFEYEATVRFSDDAAYRRFNAALEAVANDGCVMSIDGTESVSLFLKENGIRFPFEQHEDIASFFVGPAIETFYYSIKWEGGEKEYQFQKYQIKDGVVLETMKNAVVYLKLIFSKELQKVRISYQIQYQYAKSIEEVCVELKACVSLISKFYTSTKEAGMTEEADKISKVLRYLRYAVGFMERVQAVENELALSFSPQELDSISGEEQQEIEELYLLLIKKIPLRLNARLNATESTNFVISNPEEPLSIGKAIGIVFIQERSYKLLGQQFVIYTANTVINAVVKDFQKNGESITVYYGDNDSQPMYISYSAFLKEEDAELETSQFIGGEERYVYAKTGIQYVKEYLDAIS